VPAMTAALLCLKTRRSRLQPRAAAKSLHARDVPVMRERFTELLRS
jgi:hypothetical protein